MKIVENGTLDRMFAFGMVALGLSLVMRYHVTTNMWDGLLSFMVFAWAGMFWHDAELKIQSHTETARKSDD